MAAVAAAEQPRAAERARSGRSVQMNVRIDAELKREGDYALAQAGLTPSEAIRAFYQLIADDADNPSKVRELLYPHRAGERDSGISALDHARAAVDGFREHLGRPQGEPLFDEDKSCKDIYADYLMERYYPEDGGDR